MKDSELVWAARSHLIRGWFQGAPSDASGNLCAVAAVAKVTVAWVGALGRIIGHLEESLDVPLAGFNDNPATTKQDVLDLFAKTAIRLEENDL